MENYYEFEEVLKSVKGLADLLWAVAAQVECETHLRFEGALMLATTASDIENELAKLLGIGDETKDGDGA